MMSDKFFLVLVFAINWSCLKQSTSSIPCTKEVALEKAFKDYEKKHVMSDYDIEVQESDSVYKVSFILDYRKYEGGGAQYYYNKYNCALIEKVLYQ